MDRASSKRCLTDSSKWWVLLENTQLCMANVKITERIRIYNLGLKIPEYDRRFKNPRFLPNVLFMTNAKLLEGLF